MKTQPKPPSFPTQASKNGPPDADAPGEMDVGSSVTQLLQELRAGDQGAINQLLPLVYSELIRQILMDYALKESEKKINRRLGSSKCDSLAD